MTRALTTLQDLAAEGLLAPEALPALAPVAETFRIRLTPEMAALRAEAITRQFVPDPREAITRPEELLDPIGDEAHSPAPGLTHRYRDRAILHVTKTCDVYCRFCFRRETVGAAGPLPPADLEAALGYIEATPALREVILTGGDPLTLSPRRLAPLMARLAQVPHLTQIRLHSRVPVVSPERITPDLLAALTQPKAVWLVLHTNAAEELTQAATAALARLIGAGIPLLSQTVLLRGINDTPEALEALFTRLTALKVKPYYLHQCDLAPGTSHFRTTLAEGRALMAALRGRITGTALPSHVLDIPGGFGKVPVTADYLREIAPGLWEVTDPQGGRHRYEDPPRSG